MKSATNQPPDYDAIELTAEELAAAETPEQILERVKDEVSKAYGHLDYANARLWAPVCVFDIILEQIARHYHAEMVREKDERITDLSNNQMSDRLVDALEKSKKKDEEIKALQLRVWDLEEYIADIGGEITKKEAIAFANYIRDNRWRLELHGWLWHRKFSHKEPEVKTTEELYDLYKQETK